MAPQATLIHDRDIYDITYDGASDSGTVTAVFENPENMDKSSYVGADDGKFIVTVAVGYSGQSHLTVTHNDNGEVVDGGVVYFGDAQPEEAADAEAEGE